MKKMRRPKRNGVTQCPPLLLYTLDWKWQHMPKKQKKKRKRIAKCCNPIGTPYPNGYKRGPITPEQQPLIPFVKEEKKEICWLAQHTATPHLHPISHIKILLILTQTHTKIPVFKQKKLTWYQVFVSSWTTASSSPQNNLDSSGYAFSAAAAPARTLAIRLLLYSSENNWWSFSFLHICIIYLFIYYYHELGW